MERRTYAWRSNVMVTQTFPNHSKLYLGTIMFRNTEFTSLKLVYILVSSCTSHYFSSLSSLSSFVALPDLESESKHFIDLFSAYLFESFIPFDDDILRIVGDLPLSECMRSSSISSFSSSSTESLSWSSSPSCSSSVS